MNSAQPFIEPVKVTRADRKRLEPHLIGWNHLNEMFLLAKPDQVTLKKLIVLEVEGQARPQILSKLVGRLMTEERRLLRERISQCVKANSKRK